MSLLDNLGSPQQKNNILESVIENLSEGVIVANEKFEFLVWNKKGKELVGLGASEGSSEEWSDTKTIMYLNPGKMIL